MPRSRNRSITFAAIIGWLSLIRFSGTFSKSGRRQRRGQMSIYVGQKASGTRRQQHDNLRRRERGAIGPYGLARNYSGDDFLDARQSSGSMAECCGRRRQYRSPFGQACHRRIIELTAAPLLKVCQNNWLAVESVVNRVPLLSACPQSM